MWNRLIDAVTVQGGDDPARTAKLQELATPLHLLSERQQISMLSILLAPDVVRRTVSQRDIRQRGTPPFDGGSDATSTERIDAEVPAPVEEQRLSGDVMARGGQAGRRRTSTILRRVDARSGMMLTQKPVVRIGSDTASSVGTTRISQLRLQGIQIPVSKAALCLTFRSSPGNWPAFAPLRFGADAS